MKTTVEFVKDCADDRAGEVKPIDAKRAARLVRTGYVRVIETALDEAPENAARPRAHGRGPRPERRG